MTTTGVDPICGMPVDPATASSAQTEAGRYFFCSDYCRREFLRRPRERRDLQREERLALQDPSSRRVAYLSMEIALLPGVPTYAGGLGVLAGDALRSCADLRLPVVGLTLLHRQGYFTQQLGPDGEQREAPATWSPEQHLQRLGPRAEVEVEGRRVQVALWQFLLHGATGYPVPVLLLDTDLPENAPEDRALTGTLYGGDARYRLAQEVVLGIGGIRALAALGYDRIEKLHLNEGHAALAALELLEAQAWQRSSEWDFEPVRRRCVFTTHTPVPAGH
ncbi:MAG TPA: alpha-glucan family phosphorylase, partial [Aggregicoccus sp.]|nr:alpha-glucan family phosphorylase [Aggregicoccus sp.]